MPSPVNVPEHVVWQRVEDEVLLLDLSTETYVRLDDVAARMWEALDRCTDLDSAYEELKSVYDVGDDSLRSDLAGFVASLTERGLIEAAG